MKTIIRASRPPAIVRFARLIRHSPGLKTLDPFWNLLRPIFNVFLKLISRGRGLPVAIEGVGMIRVPTCFLSEDIDALEVPMLQRMVSIIRRDGCFYDVGASIGLHSLVAGHQLIEGGEIHAFEPDLPSCAKYWDNMEMLRKRLVIRLSRSFVSDLSTVPDPLSLFPNELSTATECIRNQKSRHLYLFEGSNDNLKTLHIPQISLDDYVEAGARAPTVIKCDIEGAELLFLRGAVSVIRKYKPILFISLHPNLIGRFDHTEEEFFNFLKKVEYSWDIVNSIGEIHVFAQPKV